MEEDRAEGDKETSVGSSSKSAKAADKSGCSVTETVTLVRTVLEALQNEHAEAARREHRLLNEFRLVTKRVKDLEDEVFELRSAIASSSSPRPAKGKGGSTRPTVQQNGKAQSTTVASSTDKAMTSASLVQDQTRTRTNGADGLAPAAEPPNGLVDLPSAGDGSGSQHPAEPHTSQSSGAASGLGLPQTEKNNDALWHLVTKTKPKSLLKQKALYVGNLRDDATAEGVALYVRERSQELGEEILEPSCSLVETSSSKEFLGAHLLVPAKSANLVMRRSFWPKPAYARSWKFGNTDSAMEVGTKKQTQPGRHTIPGGPQQSLFESCQSNSTVAAPSDKNQPGSQSPASITGTSSPSASISDAARAQKVVLDSQTSTAGNSSDALPKPSNLPAQSKQSEPTPCQPQSPLTLALSPESDWGCSAGVDEATVTAQAAEFSCATPGGPQSLSRGKARHHDTSSSPEGNDAKKCSAPISNDQ